MTNTLQILVSFTVIALGRLFASNPLVAGLLIQKEGFVEA